MHVRAARQPGAAGRPPASLGGVRPPLRPAPPPLEGNDRVITSVITAGWAAAAIVLLLMRDQLAAADRWWIWVAVVGFCTGLFGLAWVPYLKRSRSRAEQRRQQRRAGADAAQDGNAESPAQAGQDANER
jgi:hypothetical protein